jgi:hypothetical protein
MKSILFILLFSIALFGQKEWNKNNIFAASDSIPNITTPDTVDWRLLSPDGTPTTAWNAVTGTTISAANKTSEQTIAIALSLETGWSWGKYVEIRIRNDAATYSPKEVYQIGNTLLNVTLWVVADTTGDYVRYINSDIGGN